MDPYLTDEKRVALAETRGSRDVPRLGLDMINNKCIVYSGQTAAIKRMQRRTSKQCEKSNR